MLCHDPDTSKTRARSKMPQYNIMNNVLVIFPWLASRQQYVHRQETIDTTVPLPDGGQSERDCIQPPGDDFGIEFKRSKCEAENTDNIQRMLESQKVTYFAFNPLHDLYFDIFISVFSQAIHWIRSPNNLNHLIFMYPLPIVLTLIVVLQKAVFFC